MMTYYRAQRVHAFALYIAFLRITYVTPSMTQMRNFFTYEFVNKFGPCRPPCGSIVCRQNFRSHNRLIRCSVIYGIKHMV